ncbi:MAG: DnaJ domain-containing protein [Candidatus Aminicenantes bacterium]|nr:DnaJ domain-containing protein [Candidatus Aminicenantes bacterium]
MILRGEITLYEVMNVSRSASQQDIERAYRTAQISYEKDSLAHYTLINEEQRKKTLLEIKEAYKVLSDPEKRREYDLSISKPKSEIYHNSYFRNSTEKLYIEAGDKGITKIFKSIKGMFSSGRSKKSDP